MTGLRHGELIAQLTLEEKTALTSGANFWNTAAVPRLGIPSFMLTDGPHGVRKQGGKADHLGLNASLPATCFPTAATLANSWDVELLQRVGTALGAEAAAADVAVLLGPGLNIKRNPLGGRNFEYFSEDPMLAGELAAAFIRGVESQGVAACAKHFAVNSQETHRMAIDEIVDERALHEIYLEGFRRAVQGGSPRAIMSSYNRINGTFAHENAFLLTEVLRRQWGFTGLVVSDWGGTLDRVASIRAGGSLEMPSSNGLTDTDVLEAVRSGALDEAELDARVDEVLAVALAPRPTGSWLSTEEAHTLAVAAAERSITLLSNDGTLPLADRGVRVAVIGAFADQPRYQGAGSSLVNPTRLDRPLEALAAVGLDIVGFTPGFRRRGATNRRLLGRARALARRAEVVLLYLGLDESAEAEGVDRAHLRLADGQLRLAEQLIADGHRIVVVLAGGAPVELPFAERVAAIVHGYLGGQGGATAMARVLTGAVNPSGKLAESYPLRYDDVPSSSDFARGEATAEHRESIFVGYRYYDTVGRAVRYPFGHGLSYTSFEYGDLVVTTEGVTLTVRNSGDRAGTEVVQVYVAPRDTTFRAVQELRGFAAVPLAAGESCTVTIPLDERAFAWFDSRRSAWAIAGGEYEVRVGASSRDVRLRATLTVAGEAGPTAEGLPHYARGAVQDAPASEFVTLLGRALPDSRWSREHPLGHDDLIEQARHRRGFGRLLVRTIDAARAVLFAVGRPLAANNTVFVLGLPFRSVARMSGGAVDTAMVDGLLVMVNGRFWRGLRQYLVAARQHRRRRRDASTRTPRTVSTEQ